VTCRHAGARHHDAVPEPRAATHLAPGLDHHVAVDLDTTAAGAGG
jgi:hypothetical protein